MKKKILFSFCESDYIRNYLETNALKDLKKKYKLFYIAGKNINRAKKKVLEKENNFLGYFSYDNEKVSKYNKLNQYLSFITEKKSTSFKMVNRGIYIAVRFKWDREKNSDVIKMFFKRIILRLLRYSYYLFFKFFGKENYITKKFIKNLKINNFLKKIIIKNKPDLIVFPANGNKIMNLELVLLAKKNKIKTLKICDNWDNPSSRRFVKPTSDHIGIWGKQGQDHATKINNYKEKNSHILGTPRFENYFKLRNKKIKSHYNFKYFLLLENFINHGISDYLEQLDNIINKSNTYKNMKIVYRPHPQRKDDEFIDIKKYTNVILDQQVKKSYNIKDLKVTTDLKYYPSLIKNAEIIIAAPTSMIIESLIFYKKTIILGIKGKNYFNFHNFIKYNLHLHGIEKSPIVKINRNLNDLEEQIKSLIDLKIINKLKNKIDHHREYYFFSRRAFKNNLLNSVNKILN